MEAITDLGDSGLLLPGAAMVFVTLWLAPARRRAIAWAAAIAFCCGVMVALKIGLVPCGRPWLGRSLANPSGHAALAATFYGSLTLLWLDHITSVAGRIVVAVSVALGIVAIAASRFFIGVHTAPEVALGLGVGLLSVVVFDIVRGRGPVPRLALPLIVLLLLGGAAALYGRRAGAEDMIRRIAVIFYHWTGLC
jgi:membrane-associated phospholipid phosphatase